MHNNGLRRKDHRNQQVAVLFISVFETLDLLLQLLELSQALILLALQSHQPDAIPFHLSWFEQGRELTCACPLMLNPF